MHVELLESRSTGALVCTLCWRSLHYMQLLACFTRLVAMLQHANQRVPLVFSLAARKSSTVEHVGSRIADYGVNAALCLATCSHCRSHPA